MTEALATANNVINLSFAGLPDLPALREMQARPQWVAWSFRQRGTGKRTKPPIDPKTGSFADVTDRNTWSSYEDAEAYAIQ